MKRNPEQQVFFPDLEVPEVGPEITFGESIKVSRFLISNVTGKDRYMIKPISASAALKFILDPTEIPSRKKLIETNPFQSVFDIDTETGKIDVSEKLYELLSSAYHTDEVLEKIRTGVGEKYFSIAKNYFEKVESIGPKTEYSNSALIFSLQSPKSSFNLEDERKSKFINISTKLDEVRKGKDQDTIVRIRQNTGKPTSYDAIRLVLDWFSYMAVNKRAGFTPKFPKLQVFNLTDGKLYSWNVIPRTEYDNEERRWVLEYPMIFSEVIEAIRFSSLCLKAGFLKKDEASPNIDPNYLKDHAKKIHIKRAGRREEIITAGQGLEKAQNSIKRINGDLQPGYQLYNFLEVQPAS